MPLVFNQSATNTQSFLLNSSKFVSAVTAMIYQPTSTHGMPGTMTSLLARKLVAFYDSGSPYTEARVIIAPVDSRCVLGEEVF